MPQLSLVYTTRTYICHNLNVYLAFKIHCSNESYEALRENNDFVLEKRGTLQIKGKGALRTFWLLSRNNWNFVEDDSVPDDQLPTEIFPRSSIRPQKINSTWTVDRMSYMSLREGNPNFFRRLVEKATNRQPLTLSSVNGAGGSISGLENIIENNHPVRSSSSSIESPEASTARLDDASQSTIIAKGEPRRKSTIQSYLENISTSSIESTSGGPYREDGYIQHPYTRKRSCSVPDANSIGLKRLQHKENKFPVLGTDDNDSEESISRVKNRRRKNAMAASTAHDREELDALVQLHCPQDSASFSRRQQMEQEWDDRFGQQNRRDIGMLVIKAFKFRQTTKRLRALKTLIH